MIKKIDGENEILVIESQQVKIQIDIWNKIRVIIRPNNHMFVWVQEQRTKLIKKGVYNAFNDEDNGVLLDAVPLESSEFYRFGLWTHKTRAAFDYIRVKPFQDLHLEESFSYKRFDSDMNFDYEESSSSSDESERDDSMCIEYTSLELRKDYCEDRYQSHQDDEDVIEYCEKNFCNLCCSDKVNELNQNEVENCHKQCTNSLQKADTDEWTNICLDYEIPNQSVNHYCDTKTGSTPPQFCSQGLCHLCCVLSEELLHINFSDESIQNCYIACNEKYVPTKDNFLTQIKFDASDYEMK